jgi:hypothetical protein
MAYITKEQVADIRKTLKKVLPELKLSVRKDNSSTVDVTILAGPYDFGTTYSQVNHYNIDTPSGKHIDVLEKIKNICMKGNFDHSDVMSDYFHVGWYFHLSIGAWNRSYKLIN